MTNRQTKKPRDRKIRGFLNREPGNVLLSLEIQPTIIGAKAFHCPVRNGKEWDHPAMVARLSLLSDLFNNRPDEFFSVSQSVTVCVLQS